MFVSVCSDHETSAARIGKVEHSDNNSSDLPDHLKISLEDCGRSLNTYQLSCCRKLSEEI